MKNPRMLGFACSPPSEHLQISCLHSTDLMTNCRLGERKEDWGASFRLIMDVSILEYV
jgi:hypothetical protein